MDKRTIKAVLDNAHKFDNNRELQKLKKYVANKGLFGYNYFIHIVNRG